MESPARAGAREFPAPAGAGPGPVLLPSFTVRDTRTGAYGAKEVISTTRVSLPLQDIAQSLSVVTRELLDDTHGRRMLDSAKFVTPLLESTTSAGDNHGIRGFRTLRRFVDGVNIAPLANSMSSNLSNVERLEIIKGPNAILVPGGGIGGMVNLITKSPRTESFARLAVRGDSYGGFETSLDANRSSADKATAARLVATRWDSRGYFEGEYRRGWLFAPSFTHRFPGGAALLLKLETLRNRETNGMAVEIDPAVGTRIGGYARKHPLLPRNNLWGPADDTRNRSETRLVSELLLPAGPGRSARLWLMADHVSFVTPGIGGGTSAAGLQGGRHPLTGDWEPFQSFQYTPATGLVSMSPVVPASTTVFNRSNRQHFQLQAKELHLKGDYAMEYRLARSARGLSLAGLSVNWLASLDTRNWRTTRPAVDLASGRPVGPDEPLSRVLARDKQARQSDLQIFVFQRFNLWEDRLIASAGVARYWGELERLDHGDLPPLLVRTTRNAVTDSNLGLILKPRPEISLFAGFNRVGGALPNATVAGEFSTSSFKVGYGEQQEIGVKTSWLKGRVAVSVVYFEIQQSNAQVNNPAFQLNPFVEPAYLYFDLANRGWELEFSALLTPALEVIGNFTRMHQRDRFGIPQAMVPDEAGAIFAKYAFQHSRLRGLGLSVGADYTAKVPGDQALFHTIAGVANQPSFYLAPRVLVQAGVAYRRNHWSLGLMAHNLTDKDYIQSAASRTVLLPGEPRNYSARLEFSF